MKSSAELKVIAKEGLKGKTGQAIGAMILMAILSAIPFCSPAMMAGYAKYNLKLVRKEETSATDVTQGFNVFGKALWLQIIMVFFIYLWMMLFIIPGMVKAFAYSLSFYFLAENPTMTAREALSASKNLMQGKKGNLFYLYLTFIGWGILCMIPFVCLWVVPYMSATTAAFYNDAISQNA